MSDSADDAQGEIDNFLAHARARRAPTLVACGACHYCSEAVAADRRFCDADCRQSWDNEYKMKTRNGH